MAEQGASACFRRHSLKEQPCLLKPLLCSQDACQRCPGTQPHGHVPTSFMQLIEGFRFAHCALEVAFRKEIAAANHSCPDLFVYQLFRSEDSCASWRSLSSAGVLPSFRVRS